MPDYSKTIIYRICCNDTNIKDIYIGSTCNFNQRKYQHKRNCNNKKLKQYNYFVYQFIREHGGFENWSMVQIEEVECKNKREKLKKEREYMDKLKPTLNKIKSYQSQEERKEYKLKHSQSEEQKQKKKEYRDTHKEEMKDYKKQWHQDNKERLNQKSREYKEDHKERIQEYGKEYYEQNKEEIARKKKEKYEQNKEEIARKRKELIKCVVCDKDVRRYDISRHYHSKSHIINFIEY